MTESPVNVCVIVRSRDKIIIINKRCLKPYKPVGVNVNRIVSSWIGKKKSSSDDVLPLYSCKNSVTWHKMFHSSLRRHTWMYCLNNLQAFAADLLAQQLSISECQ